MIFSDFSKAVSQLTDRRFIRVLFFGIALTVALLFGIYALFLTAISSFGPDVLTLPIVGEITWVKDLLGWGSVLIMFGLSFFLMIPVASAFTGLFLEDVARAVEQKHYPNLPPTSRVPFGETLVDTLNFLGLLIGANILAVILYTVLNVFSPLAFWTINGYLLGREYFQMAAMRRLGRIGAKAFGKKHRFEIWVAGVLMTIPLTIPLVNLLIPVLAAATFTHMFQRLEGGVK